MKHHLYQIYYGGWKKKYKFLFYCETCKVFKTCYTDAEKKEHNALDK